MLSRAPSSGVPFLLDNRGRSRLSILRRQVARVRGGCRRWVDAQPELPRRPWFYCWGNNRYITLGPRYRRWLSEKTALDVGLSAARTPGRIEIIELHVAMMYGDKVGLWVNATYDWGRGDPGLAVGIQAGSEPALVGYAVGATVFFIYALQ